MLKIDQKEFFASLKITQAYCAQQLQQPWQSEFLALRTSLQPVYRNQQWFVTALGIKGDAATLELAEWLRQTNPDDPARFADVFTHQLAHKTAASAKLALQVFYPGRILIADYGENIPDGGVEMETAGFFDEFDLPPIDTWFYNGYSEPERGLLFAWIPEQFVGLAQRAIEVQFLDILHWFVTPQGWGNDPYAAHPDVT